MGYILHCAGLKVEQEDCNESELERVERRYVLYSTLRTVFYCTLLFLYCNLQYTACVLYCAGFLISKFLLVCVINTNRYISNVIAIFLLCICILGTLTLK
jgi:hypothetical protein